MRSRGCGCRPPLRLHSRADHGKYVTYFDAYVRAIDGGLDPDSAFKRAFGEGTEALQAKYEAYIKDLKPSGLRD